MERIVLEERLGLGGVAEVFLARRREPDGSFTRCAVKRLRPEFQLDQSAQLRFQDEVRIASGLQHECIVSVSECVELAGITSIVMEYVDGVSLERLIARGLAGQFLPLRVIGFVAHEAARALACAHGQRVLHRDVSASNLLISAVGVVKLADFGLADAVGRLSETAPGTVVGKWTYLSPSRRQGAPATARDDIYSLGVVLERMLAASDPRQRRQRLGEQLRGLSNRLTDETHTGITGEDVVDELRQLERADSEETAAFLRAPGPRARAARPGVENLLGTTVNEVPPKRRP